MALTPEAQTALVALYQQIGPGITAFVEQYGFDSLKEGVDAINSSQAATTALSSFGAVVTGEVSDWTGLRAVSVPSTSLTTLLATYTAAKAAGSANTMLRAAVAIAEAERALRGA